MNLDDFGCGMVDTNCSFDAVFDVATTKKREHTEHTKQICTLRQPLCCFFYILTIF